jgi:hypothetical protein
MVERHHERERQEQTLSNAQLGMEGKTRNLNRNGKRKTAVDPGGEKSGTHRGSDAA